MKVPATIDLSHTACLKPGDVVGFSGRSWLSAAINFGSYGIPLWGISHVGILAESSGRLLLFEALVDSSLTPCHVCGEQKPGVHAHPLDDVCNVYSGSVWHYPLYRPLYEHERTRLTNFLNGVDGSEYDPIGALRSGGFLLAWIESLFRRQELSLFFCSELVAAAYAYTGLFATSNASGWNPNSLTRALRLAGVLCKPRRLP